MQKEIAKLKKSAPVAKKPATAAAPLKFKSE
jgi:hypothetical protein